MWAMSTNELRCIFHNAMTNKFQFKLSNFTMLNIIQIYMERGQ